MKLKKGSGLEIESSDAFEQEQDVTMSSKNVGHIIRALSNTIYQDKAGSMVREMVSNAWDANREAGSSAAVVVEVADQQLIIKDEGPGFSEDRISKVFASFGESTKRHADDDIGGFGIGSKTPLAYTSDYTIRTWVDGIRYVYLIHQTEDLPRIKRLEKTKDPDHPNGTHAIIGIKPGDKDKIQAAIKSQLIYFDNLYMIGVPGWDNNYELIRGKNFIINTKFPPSQSNICLGQVAYPIPYRLIEQALSELKQREFPSISASQTSSFSGWRIGLTFKIGELSVTLSREQIEFDSEEVEQAIVDRLVAAIREIVGMYKKQQTEDKYLLEYFTQTQNKSVEFRREDDTLISLNLNWIAGLENKIPPNLAKFPLRAFEWNMKHSRCFYDVVTANGSVISKAQSPCRVGGAFIKPLTSWYDLLDRVRNSNQIGYSFDHIYLVYPGEKIHRKNLLYESQRRNTYVMAVRYDPKVLTQAYSDGKYHFDEKYISELTKELKRLGVKEYSDIQVPEGWGKTKNNPKSSEIHLTEIPSGSDLGHQTTYKKFINTRRAQNSSFKCRPFILIPKALRQEFDWLTIDMRTPIILCASAHYKYLLETNYFMSLEDYLKNHRKFREEITCYKIGKLFPDFLDVKPSKEDITPFLSQSEETSYTEFNEVVAWNHMRSSSTIVNSLLDYIDQEPYSNFYRQDWIKTAEKVYNISKCDDIWQVQAVDNPQLVAKIYLKIIKNPLTNEYIKKYLLRQARIEQSTD